MILLLQGASDVARAAVAGKLVQEYPEWKHIPLEILYEVTQKYGLDLGSNEQVLTRVACHTARELHDQHFHIVLSSPAAADILSVMEDEFGEDLVTVHLGTEELEDPSVFDHVIDTSTQSINEAYGVILSLIAEHPS